MKRYFVKLRRGNTSESLEKKKTEVTIVSLDWAPEEDVLLVNMRNKTYTNKEKGNIPKTTFSPSSSSQHTNPQVVTKNQILEA
jgi:hypothetical protein